MFNWLMPFLLMMFLWSFSIGCRFGHATAFSFASSAPDHCLLIIQRGIGILKGCTFEQIVKASTEATTDDYSQKGSPTLSLQSRRIFESTESTRRTAMHSASIFALCPRQSLNNILHCVFALRTAKQRLKTKAAIAAD